jgi:hypothetical protein
MLNDYEDYLELIQEQGIADGLNDFRLARNEFHNLTGKFENGEQWFELRMMMFFDWYLMDRPGRNLLTPVQHFLSFHKDQLNDEQLIQMEYLTVSLRSCFQVLESNGDRLVLRDLIRGGHWNVHCTMPTVGLNRDDILDTRVVYFSGQPIMGRSTVLHPKDANETILVIVERARKESFDARQLVAHLDKMRLKLDRYSNVRIQHVYRYPGDAVF